MNRRVRLALMGLLFVVVIALGWFFLLAPVRSDIATTNASIDTERTNLAAAQAKLAQAQATRQEAQKNQGRLLELAKLVPDSEEIPSLLLEIQSLADQSGIALTSITPAEPIEDGAFEIIPMDVQFTGTFFDVSDFVYRAEQMAAAPGRLLAVKNLNLQLNQQTTGESTSNASAGPQLQVGMTLYAFMMSPPAGSSTGGTTTQASAASGAQPSSNQTTTTATTSGT